jgi:hypothetical protein
MNISPVAILATFSGLKGLKRVLKEFLSKIKFSVGVYSTNTLTEYQPGYFLPNQKLIQGNHSKRSHLLYQLSYFQPIGQKTGVEPVTE